jgi:antibiotic biosynthesis monooxygenase (ABM) superfamily enzyme
MSGGRLVGAPLPVTILVTRTATPGPGEVLIAWADDLCRDAARMPGHLATHVSRVQGEDRTAVRIGVTFASAEELLRWERSAVRSQRLAEIDALTDGPPVALSVDDLERWGLTSRPADAVPLTAALGDPHLDRSSPARTADERAGDARPR